MLSRRLFLGAMPLAAGAWQGPAELALIPRPASLTRREGELVVDGRTAITAAAGTQAEARYLAALLNCPLAGDTPPESCISLALDPSLERYGREGYWLEVAPGGAKLLASTTAGLFHAVQTVRQLLPATACSAEGRGTDEWRLPAVEIEDRPRFGWRGMHLDVARHFHNKATVMAYLDLLALHKLNTFHFHLTDDQGWRIEIKRFPKLARIGSRRRQTRVGHENAGGGFDGKPHGGFFTQNDIREIVAYASARHINVVPEIEMPGHAQAALAAYPEFGNTGEHIEVWGQWGVSKNVFAVNERTIRFLQHVLVEVMAIFPSRYIHVGGDEVPHDQWKASAEAQARMKALKLKNEAELQTWFIGRMNTFLRAHGRTLVGWDEIIEGGNTPGAVVMSWRGEQGGITAARAGHDVVMTPDQLTYLNYAQSKAATEPLSIGGFIDLRKIYEYEPVPAALSSADARHVLGTQAQLWTEYIPTRELLDYMAFPRLAALAEVAWTAKDRRSFADFSSRLPTHLDRLRAAGVKFRPLDA
jgi:hexosaminidase